jgi:hypothetical protein
MHFSYWHFVHAIAMAKSDPHATKLPSALLLLTTILLVCPTGYADQSQSDGPDTTAVSKDSVCDCGTECGLPCLYYSPPPSSALRPPSEMPPPEVPSPELYSPPPPFWPWPTPLPPYPWYKPPPPHGEVCGADGGFEFYKPSLAWHSSVSWAKLILVSGVILVLCLWAGKKNDLLK